MLPFSWNGSLTIYQRVIRPFVLKHQRQLDSAIDTVSGAAQAFGGEGKRRLMLMQLINCLLTVTLSFTLSYSYGRILRQ
jgi:hypothetical protein